MTIEGAFLQFVNGLLLGSGMITAAIVFKALFHAGFCG
jgi:hypothetical protein